MPLHIADQTAQIIWQLLIDGSKISSSSSYMNSWPDDAKDDSFIIPDNIVAIFDDAVRTRNFGSSLIDGFVFEHHGFQVRARNESQTGGFNALTTIKDYFDTGAINTSVTVNGRSYIVEKVTRRQNIFYLGTEKNSDRHLLVLNAKAAIRRLS